ncbi:uncharacterized protein RHOBADRAFT_44002, partial [Rhodotorula graminis WP1]
SYASLALLDYFSPRDRLERAPKFDRERWKQICREELAKEAVADAALVDEDGDEHDGCIAKLDM